MEGANLPKTPSRGIWKVGRVEGMNGWYTQLVVRAGGDSRSKQLPGASPKDMGLFWAPPMNERDTWCLKLLSGSTGTLVSPPEGFPLAARPNIFLLGYQGGTVGEDCSLGTGPTVLGREVQPANAGSTIPLGEVCPWTEGDNGPVHIFLWWYHFGQCCPTGGVSWRLDKGNCP